MSETIAVRGTRGIDKKKGCLEEVGKGREREEDIRVNFKYHNN